MIDTSGGQPVAGLVEYAVDKIGAERILFGSDLYGAVGRDPACQLGRILGADISEQAKKLITELNAKRILKI
jgi:predicted TIM-barrel fold metal-dependent hydrolase